MSVRIKVSYTDELELDKLQQRLTPGIERCSLSREQKGKHKRAYIDWNSNASDQEEVAKNFRKLQFSGENVSKC